MLDTAQWGTWWAAGAWDSLVPQICSVVEREVRSLTKLDTDTAQDISSCVAVRCWKLSYVPDNPLAFVSRVTRNRIIDHFNSAYVKYRVSGVEIEYAAANYLDDDTDDDLLRMREAIGKMPEHQRNLLVWHHVDGKSIADISSILQIGPGAINMRMARARNCLVKLIYPPQPKIKPVKSQAKPPKMPRVRLSAEERKRRKAETRRLKYVRRYVHPIRVALARMGPAQQEDLLGRLPNRMAVLIRKYDIQQHQHQSTVVLRQRLYRARKAFLKLANDTIGVK